ncbi:MAG: hypothetical protein ACK4V1_08995 [Burkholderiaceae bacterium]
MPPEHALDLIETDADRERMRDRMIGHGSAAACVWPAHRARRNLRDISAVAACGRTPATRATMAPLHARQQTVGGAGATPRVGFEHESVERSADLWIDDGAGQRAV